MGSCFMMGWGWLLLALILVSVAIFMLSGKAFGRKGGKTAEEIIEERYAKGEIDEKEYIKMKKMLERGEDES